ncbi:MAG: hypothetical protein ACKOCH_07320, partial [Bacteroidota bacterium]
FVGYFFGKVPLLHQSERLVFLLEEAYRFFTDQAAFTRKSEKATVSRGQFVPYGLSIQPALRST